MKGITAEQARELAVGVKSAEVSAAMNNLDSGICKKASQGYLETTFTMKYRTQAVEQKCIELLKERGFNVSSIGCRDILVKWGE